VKIFLIGLSGVGKSTLGKQLSDRLEARFIDLDAEIEKSEQNSIDFIFKNKGENYFRELETKHLKSEKIEFDFVMATGGGTPCFFDNMNWMLQNGVVVYLQLPILDLVSRLSTSYSRPLLNGTNPDEIELMLENQLKERAGIYSRAHLSIDMRNVKLEEVVSLINWTNK